MIEQNSSSLKGHLLLAMPQMNDPRFHRAVIFMGAHDPKGAMGIVINNPIPTLHFGDVLSQVGIKEGKTLDRSLSDRPVMAGGPVEGIHGFLLHTADFRQKDTIIVDDHFAISGTIESLRSIVSGYRPEHMLFALGYAGWGAGQIEKEMQDNVWLSIPASHEIIFATPPDEMWEKSFSAIGITPSQISAVSGRA